MKSNRLKPNEYFTIGTMTSIYQVNAQGTEAKLVIDRSGGKIRTTIDLTAEPDIDVTVIPAEEVKS